MDAVGYALAKALVDATYSQPSTLPNKADTPIAASNLHAVAIAYGNLIYFGSPESGLPTSFWSYDPVANTYTEKAQNANPNLMFRAGMTLVGDNIYVHCMVTAGTGSGTLKYNIPGNSWSLDTTNKTSFQNVSAAYSAASGVIYCLEYGEFGGAIYDLTAKTYTAKANDTPRHYTNVVCIGSKIYVGDAAGTQGTSSLRIYDIPSNTWSVAAALSSGQNFYMGALGVYQGRYVVCAGSNYNSVGYGFLSIYDTQTNTWSYPLGTGSNALEDFFFGALVPNPVNPVNVHWMGAYNGASYSRYHRVFVPVSLPNPKAGPLLGYLASK